MTTQHDLVVRDGLIVDGTGGTLFQNYLEFNGPTARYSWVYSMT